MKTIAFILTAVFVTVCSFAQNVSPATNPPVAPSALNTNANVLMVNSLAESVRALQLSTAQLRGQCDGIEDQMNRIEIGFLVLVIIFVATIISICFVVARDSARRNRHGFAGSNPGPTVASAITPK